MIRKGDFAMYDYGLWGNLKQYGHLRPPSFDLANIPKSLPLWMAYGGEDALADVTDVKHTIQELQAKPELLYLESYGHIDFILSVYAKNDVYDKLIEFFKSQGSSRSYWVPVAMYSVTEQILSMTTIHFPSFIWYVFEEYREGNTPRHSVIHYYQMYEPTRGFNFFFLIECTNFFKKQKEKKVFCTGSLGPWVAL